MALKRSRRSIVFIKLISRFATALGLMPMYDFDEHRVAHKKIYKTYSLFLTLTIASATAWNIYIRSKSEQFKTDKRNAVIYLSVEEFSGLTQCILTAIGYLSWQMKSLRRLYKRILYLENEINKEEPISKSVFKNANFLFISGTVCMLVVYGQVIIGNNVRIKKAISIMPVFYNYAEFVIFTVIFNIALAIRWKYSDINDMICELREGNLTNTLSKVRELYSVMDYVVDTFNDLFGWQIFLGFLRTAIKILNYMHLIIIRPGNVSIYPITIVFVVLAMFGPVTIMFCFDMTIRESQNAIKICYRLDRKEFLSAEERQDLRDLIHQVRINAPKFTAAGFFEINRSTLFAFLGATTTYLIVVIQFHGM